SSYYYTDASLIEAFHNGSGSTDTSNTEVKSSGATAATHGTAANPFVINTVAQWTKFATDTNTTNSALDATKVFVLGSDLDFESTQGNFKPVPTLKAKFYGTNHKLKNITHNFGGVTGNYGVFCVVTADAVVTDVSLDNVNMTGVVAGKEYNYSGTLIGDNLGASVLNCHAKGSLSGTKSYYTTATDSKASEIGGLMGSFRSGGSGYVYRCSVDITLTFSITTHGGGGGIIGNVNQGATVKMYDCFAIVHWVVAVSKYDIYIGGLVGIQHNRDSASTIILENCVSYMKATYSGTANITLDSPTVSGYGPKGTKLTFNNIYTSGERTYGANSAYNTDLFGSVWYGSSDEYGTKVVSGSNYNWYAQSVSSVWASYQPVHLAVARGVTANQYNGTAGKTREDLYNDASNSTFLRNTIWVNKGVIDEEYMTGFAGTTACKYTIDNSPVRNPLVVRVSYYNHKTSGDEAIAFSGVTQPVIKKAGDSLERPADTATREFIGWTTDANWTQDKMGTDEAPFTSMPASLIGDNKLYAVWRAKTASVDISATLGGSKLTYDATKGFSGEYDGTGIVLSADLTVDGMTKTDVNASYQWEWKGNKITEDGTNQTYTVKYVNKNGNYGVVVNFHSKSEPLFFGQTFTVDSKKVTMEPVDSKKLIIRNPRLPDGKTAYVGADLSSVSPLGDVIFNMKTLKGTLAWDNSNDAFGSMIPEGSNSNEETRTIIFIPSDDYGGNYGTSAAFKITYEVTYLQFTFHLDGFADPTKKQIQVDLKYGDNYSYSKIADLFEEAIEPYMGILNGKAPIFQMLDGDEYKIDSFRKQNKWFEYVSDPEVLQITVQFDFESHIVKFDPNGGTYEEGMEPSDQSVRYGFHASAPDVPPTRDPLLFLGWFYDSTDADGHPIEVQWDFNNSVTRDLNLHAVWLAADTLTDLKVTVAPGTVFNANEAIDKSTLTVTATFSGTRDDAKVSQTVVLSPSQYTIEYYRSYIDEDNNQISGDGKLHVTEDGTPTKVIIRYISDGSINTNGVKAMLDITPKKILLDTQKLIDKGAFGNSTVEIDPEGKPISLTITKGAIANEFGYLLSDDDVTYTYMRANGDPIDPSEVTKAGEYTVVAHFEPLYRDYEAPDLTVTLKIVTQKEVLTVTWDATEFTFNNKVQTPKPTFYNELNQEVKNVNYHLDGDTNVMTVGEYQVLLLLDDTGYRLSENVVLTKFNIKKATVKVPTQLEKLPYLGIEYNLSNLPDAYKFYFENLDTDLVNVSNATGDSATGTNANIYTAYITLKDPVNSEWDGVTGLRQQMTWEIERAQLSVSWGNEQKFAINADVPGVVYFVGLMDADYGVAELSDLIYTGDSDMSQEGPHTLTVSLKSSAAWTKNYQLDDSKSFTFVVTDAQGDVIMVRVVWDGKNQFVYKDNEWQGPGFSLIVKDTGEDVTELLRDSLTIENGTKLWAGSYDVKLSLDPASGHYLFGVTQYHYTISKDKDGNGADPETLTPGGGNENKGNEGNTGSDDTLSIPWWQVIMSGVCTVLFVVCFAKSYSNLSKAKAAKNETKELAAQSYAVNYAFAPLPLLAVKPFLGMGETPWTIIAFVTLGILLVSLAAMFITSKKRKAAELALKREQARVAEEKEYAREEAQRLREEQVRAEMREEQARRDNEMKMMFAAMQQNYQPPMYDDSHMQNMIASTISALLPAMQQQMALPPAQSDPNAYAAPSGMSAEAQNEINRLHAQMAQQQELLNQLLQNQQSQQQAYEDEPVDDISWLGASDEVVSLEESYGALSDEGKRAYYDIGSYIMSKPRTSQNDGRYAVLFKYRGRTIFKLSIKDDAPVLYYPAGNGKAEVRVFDASSLEIAKSVIDQTVSSVDSQM
ncbi:MAG: hypothetical protein K2L02_02120, partial [Clostridia bacterium]|nr:hypothetical protein [Clostridia bacterium]